MVKNIDVGMRPGFKYHLCHKPFNSNTCVFVCVFMNGDKIVTNPTYIVIIK